MSRWTEFKPRRFMGKAKLDGVVSIGKVTFLVAENLAERGLKGFKYVKLLYDEKDGLVGIMPAKDGYKIHRSEKYKSVRISAHSFMKFYKLARGYYPAEWDDDVLVFKPDVEKEASS